MSSKEMAKGRFQQYRVMHEKEQKVKRILSSVLLLLPAPVLFAQLLPQTLESDAGVPQAYDKNESASSKIAAEETPELTSGMSGLTLFFSAEQRDNQSAYHLVNQAEKADLAEVDALSEKSTTGSDNHAPVIIKLQPNTSLENTINQAVRYTALHSSGETIRLLVNDLPCLPVEKDLHDVNACSHANTGVKNGYVLNCPQLPATNYVACLDSDLSTLVIVDSAGAVARMQVGDYVD